MRRLRWVKWGGIRVARCPVFDRTVRFDSLEAGGQIDVIYTDLEKAFDKVPHQRLVKKIKILQSKS